MWEYTHYDELCHHGVKGMRWGVRRTPAQLGHKVTRVKKKKHSKVSTESKPKTLTTEEKKSQVLDSRSAKTLYENRKLFNYDEMNRAYKLLETDKKVKDLIVHQPNKVEKFVDDKIIPWANRIKNIAEPVAATLKKVDEISKLFGGDDNNSSNANGKSGKKNTKSDKEKESKSEQAKEKESKSEKRKDDNAESSSTRTNTGSKNERGKSSSRSSDTIWDVDYVDITPSRGTTSFVSQLGSTSVSALPSSSQASTFIAGLLGESKE